MHPYGTAALALAACLKSVARKITRAYRLGRSKDWLGIFISYHDLTSKEWLVHGSPQTAMRELHQVISNLTRPVNCPSQTVDWHLLCIHFSNEALQHVDALQALLLSALKIRKTDVNPRHGRSP